MKCGCWIIGKPCSLSGGNGPSWTRNGGTENAVASVALERTGKNEPVAMDTDETNYELLSEEDMEEYFKTMEDKEHEKDTEKQPEE